MISFTNQQKASIARRPHSRRRCYLVHLYAKLRSFGTDRIPRGVTPAAMGGQGGQLMGWSSRCLRRASGADAADDVITSMWEAEGAMEHRSGQLGTRGLFCGPGAIEGLALCLVPLTRIWH